MAVIGTVTCMQMVDFMWLVQILDGMDDLRARWVFTLGIL